MTNNSSYVFISYKSDELEKAKEIQHYLESQGCKCWRAPESLNDRGTQDYSSDIFDAIRRSSCLLFVLSNRALCSDWVRKEVKYALERCHKPIIPYVVDRIPAAKYETDELMISLTLQKQLLNENLSGDMSVILPYVQRLDSTGEESGTVEDGKPKKDNVSKMAQEDLKRLESEADFYLERIEELSKVNFFTCGNDYPFGMKRREKEADVCIAAKRLITLVAAITDGVVAVDVEHGRAICNKLNKLTYQFGQYFTDEVFTLVDQFVMRDNPAPWACFVTHVKYYRPTVCGADSGELTYKMLAISVRDNDNPYAAIRMGICFEFGLGCQVSGVAARYWFERAEQYGCAEVYNRLGQMYHWGVCEIKKDKDRAKDYYWKGVASNVFSCYAKLFCLLLNSEDDSEAYDCLCRGCENGDESALSDVAEYFENIGEEYKKKYSTVTQQDMRWRACCVNNPEYRSNLAFDIFNNGDLDKFNFAFDHLVSGVSQRHATCSERMGDLMLSDVSLQFQRQEEEDSSNYDSIAIFNESLEFIRSEVGREKNSHARFIVGMIEECEVELKNNPDKMKRRLVALEWNRYFNHDSTTEACADSPFWTLITDCQKDDKGTHLFDAEKYPSHLAAFNSVTPYRLLNAILRYPASPDSDLGKVQKIWRQLRLLDYEKVDVDQIIKGQGVCLTTGAATTNLERVRRIKQICSELAQLIVNPNEFSKIVSELKDLEIRMEMAVNSSDFSDEIQEKLHVGRKVAASLCKDDRLVRIAFHLAQEEYRCSHPKLDIALDCYRTAFVRGGSGNQALKLATLFFVNNARSRSEEANESVLYSIRDALFKAVDMGTITAVPLFLETALFGSKVGASSVEPDFQAIIKAEPLIEAMILEDDDEIKVFGIERRITFFVFRVKIACVMAKIFMDSSLTCIARCEQKWGTSTLLDRAKAILWLKRARQLLEKVKKVVAGVGDEIVIKEEPFLSEDFERELKTQSKKLGDFVGGVFDELEVGSSQGRKGNAEQPENNANENGGSGNYTIQKLDKKWVDEVEQAVKDINSHYANLQLSFFPHVKLEEDTVPSVVSTDLTAILLCQLPGDQDYKIQEVMGMDWHYGVPELAPGVVALDFVPMLLNIGKTLERLEPDSNVELGVIATSNTCENLCEQLKQLGLVGKINLFNYERLADQLVEVFGRYGEVSSASAEVCPSTNDEIFDKAYATYKRENYEEAFPLFMKLAEDGYAKAFGYVGLAYELGKGVGKNVEVAISYYKKSIEAHEHLGVYRLGMLYRNRGQYELAFGLYKKAIDQDLATADDYFQIAKMLERGMGTKRNLQQAVAYYKTAMRTKDQFHARDAREALVRLGALYDKDDFDVTLPEELINADTDRLYSQGKEKIDDFHDPDIPFAFACFRLAADKGHALAAYKVSEIYSKKEYPIFDKKKAKAYAEIASEGMVRLVEGKVSYAFDAGCAYSCEDSCIHDYAKAQECFELGAKANDKDCEWKLGIICKRNGDDERAFQLFLAAAEQGQGMAMYEVAQCYDKGIGTKSDRDNAILWYKRCKASRYAASHNAERRLDELHKRK